MDGEKNMNEEQRQKASEKAQEFFNNVVDLSANSGKRVVAAPTEKQITYVIGASNRTARNIAKEAGLPPSLARRKPNVIHKTNIAHGLKAELVETTDGLEPRINGQPVPFGAKISTLKTSSEG